MPNDALKGLKQAMTWKEGPDESDPGYVQNMVDLALQQLQTQGFPEAKTVRAKPMGLLRYALPSAAASASPYTGNISYAEDLMRNLPRNEIINSMAHELTHTRQIQQTPWYKRPFAYAAQAGLPYRQRPWEQEAFGTEAKRQAARRDITLPDGK